MIFLISFKTVTEKFLNKVEQDPTGDKKRNGSGNSNDNGRVFRPASFKYTHLSISDLYKHRFKRRDRRRVFSGQQFYSGDNIADFAAHHKLQL